MGTRTDEAWLRLAVDAWRLGAESAYVAGLRMGRMATGSLPIAAETRLMVAEKVQAAIELQGDAMLNAMDRSPLAAGRHALAHYRRKVRANRRRLSR